MRGGLVATFASPLHKAVPSNSRKYQFSANGVVTLLKVKHDKSTPRILSSDGNCLAPRINGVPRALLSEDLRAPCSAEEASHTESSAERPTNPVPSVKLRERPRLTGEHLINQRADQTQRMIQRYPSFKVNVTYSLATG